VLPEPLLALPPERAEPLSDPLELLRSEEGFDVALIVAVGWHSIASIDPGAAFAQFAADCALTKLVVASKNAALAATITP
jgi:hypothetical protein